MCSVSDPSSTAPSLDAMYRVKYDFRGQDHKELSIERGELVVIVSKECNVEFQGKSDLYQA